MILRYSLPRHLMAGCARPRGPRAANSAGFNTIPSPPAEVSSCHQLVASATLVVSVTSTFLNGVVTSKPSPALEISRSVSICQKSDRVDLERQRRRATLRPGFGIKDMRLPKRQFGGVNPRGILVQQIAQVRGRPPGIR